MSEHDERVKNAAIKHWTKYKSIYDADRKSPRSKGLGDAINFCLNKVATVYPFTLSNVLKVLERERDMAWGKYQEALGEHVIMKKPGAEEREDYYNGYWDNLDIQIGTIKEWYGAI